MSIELMLNAVNLTFVALRAAAAASIDGQVIVFFVMTVAAAEAAVGLAIIIAVVPQPADGQRRRARRCCAGEPMHETPRHRSRDPALAGALADPGCCRCSGSLIAIVARERAPGLGDDHRRRSRVAGVVRGRARVGACSSRAPPTGARCVRPRLHLDRRRPACTPTSPSASTRCSAVMVLIVTGVGFLIHVYSRRLHARTTPTCARFFAYLNLFIVLDAAARARRQPARCCSSAGRASASAPTC